MRNNLARNIELADIQIIKRAYEYWTHPTTNFILQFILLYASQGKLRKFRDE